MKAIDRITNHQTNLVSSVLIPICAAVLTVANREDPMDGGVFSEIIAGTLIWIYMFFVTSGFIQHIDALFIIPVSQKRRAEKYLFNIERIALMMFVWTVVFNLLLGKVSCIPYEILRLEGLLCIIYTANLSVKLRLGGSLEGDRATTVLLLYLLCIPEFGVITFLKAMDNITLMIVSAVASAVFLVPVCMFRRYVKNRLIKSID